MIRGQSEPYHLVDGRFYDERGDWEPVPLPSNNGVDDRLTPKEGNQKLATFLIDLSPGDMQRRLGDALSVYVDAMRYPRGTEDQRASMWVEHTRRHGWKGVAAVEVPDHGDFADAPDRSASALAAAPLLGVAYGYCGAPDQWWQQQVVAGLHRVGADRMRIAELMTSYFELTELHIAPHAQGRGLGEALARRLLAGRGEAHVLLSTPEINGESNRAWRLYRRLGFTDIIRGYHFAGDPRAFAILGRALPL
jgi:ribosomal protein S18 acetylase RimI-like enzyme